MALTNAFVLFRPHHQVPMKTFQQVLAVQLVGSYHSRKSAGRVSYPTRPLQLQHFPMKPQNPEEGRKRGRCVICKRGVTPNGTVESVECGCVTQATQMIVFTYTTGGFELFTQFPPPSPPPPSHPSLHSFFSPITLSLTNYTPSRKKDKT